MKIFAIHGGPRKNKNTDKMLDAFIAGAKSTGEDVEVEKLDLFDLKFKGCMSCFACKLKNGVSYGKCSYDDELKPILERIGLADGIVCATPIYFHDVSGQLRMFLERLFFQYHSFKKNEKSIAVKPLQSCMIYTMNITQQQMEKSGYRNNLKLTEQYFEYIFKHYPETIYAFNTLLFDDYSHHELSYWNLEEKKKYHQEQFPKDLNQAYQSGKRMVTKIRNGDNR